MSFLDLIFPKKCINCRRFGDFVCSDCFSRIKFNDNFQCPVCFRPSVNGLTHPVCKARYSLDGVISVVAYSPVTKRMIQQFKYKPYVSKLKDTIGEIMIEGLLQNESFYSFIEKYTPALIPVPLSMKKFRSRGYNHAELLASYVAKYFHLVISNKLLVRVKDTRPQYKLGKKERFENIRGAFNIRESAGRRTEIPKSVIIIDDIATSFATLHEAAKVLKRAGTKKVLGITFAKEL